jgi:mannose-1-phosphate guanylyltransferase
MKYAVIMAGGSGKRLWPLSRKKTPKQMLRLIKNKTLLRICYERIAPIFQTDHVLILTNAHFRDAVAQELPEIPSKNIIAEPAMRDTAPAIALAAAVLAKSDPHASMVILTADHLIEPPENLCAAINDAFAFVENNADALITFAIKPTNPNTQFGYLELGQSQTCDYAQNPIAKVHSFKEKPDLQTAQKYLDSGNFFWNSGMFVFKASAMLDNIKNNLPDAIPPLDNLKAAWNTPDWDNTLKTNFPLMPKISIDYAVMEKSDTVHSITLDCSWLDVGSFNAIEKILPPDENKNVLANTTAQLIDSSENIIITKNNDHLIAAIGVSDLVIAHTPDATLICHKKQTHKLKELLEQLEKRDLDKYL